MNVVSITMIILGLFLLRQSIYHYIDNRKGKKYKLYTVSLFTWATATTLLVVYIQTH